MASKRSLEERIREKDERMQKALEKAKQYEAQKKQLEQRQKEADRKARAHRLIEIGATAESVLGREFVTGDIERFLNFLKTQERNGSFYSKAMQKPTVSAVATRAKAKAVSQPAVETEIMETAETKSVTMPEVNKDAAQYDPFGQP